MVPRSVVLRVLSFVPPGMNLIVTSRNVHPSERDSSAGGDDQGSFPNAPDYPPSSTNASHSIASNTGGAPNTFHAITGDASTTSDSPTTSTAATPAVKTTGSKERYSLIFVLENPTSEELATRRPINTDSLVSLVTRTDRIPGLLNWIQGRDEQCRHGPFTNSAVSTQVSPFLENRTLSDQTQYAQPHLNEPVDQEMSGHAEETESETEILTDRLCAYVVHGSVSDSASEYGKIQSGSVYADLTTLEPYFQTLQPALNRNQWSIGCGIKSRAHLTSRFIPNFDPLSPVTEQSPTEPEASLLAAPVSPIFTKDRRQRSKDLSSRSKKSFRTREDVQSLRTKILARTLARAQANATKEAEALKDAQRKADTGTTPGQKRKRSHIPETISSTKDYSFGLDLDYFGCDSSDEGEEPVIRPSKQPTKVRRTDGRLGAKRFHISQLLDSNSEEDEQMAGEMETYFTPPEDKNLGLQTEVGQDANIDPNLYQSHFFNPNQLPFNPGGPELENTPTISIPRARVFAKEDHEIKGREEHAWDVSPLTPTHASSKSTVPSTTHSDNPASRKRSSNSSKENNSPGLIGFPSSAQPATPAANAAFAPSRITSSWTRASHPASLSVVGSLQLGPLSGSSQTMPLYSNITTEAERLRKARNKALQYKPRTPSSLSHWSRINSSLVGAPSEEENRSPIHNASLT